MFVPLSGVVEETEYMDYAPAGSARYRLIALNGLGEEHILGETSVAPALRGDRDLLAFPNPATNGSINILFRIPFERPLELGVYDPSGRLVRRLASGQYPVGTQSVTWDRHDEGGNPVGAGVYLLRLTSAPSFEARERVTLIR
jgi:hypothetical protein